MKKKHDQDRVETDDRIYLMDKIIALGLGYDENLSQLNAETLEAMYKELKAAQDAGELNLETAAGVDNLERIVNKYEYPDE
jgi:hypothetical protein